MATVLVEVVHGEEEDVELAAVVAVDKEVQEVAVVEEEVQGAAVDTGEEVVASAVMGAAAVAPVAPKSEVAALKEGPKVLVLVGMVLGYTSRLY